MEISKINTLKDRFKNAIDKHYVFESQFLCDSINNFGENWRLADDDLPKMWSNALYSNISRHHWQHQNYQPKKWITTFFKLDEDFTKSMFYDLFSNEHKLSSRLERFQFYSDELLILYRSNNKMSIDTNHHQDHKVIMLYLTHMFPEQYCLYNFEDFQYFVGFVKARTLLTIHDMDRYQKLVKLVYNIVSKDDSFMDKFAKYYNYNNSTIAKYSVVFELFRFGRNNS